MAAPDVAPPTADAIFLVTRSTALRTGRLAVLAGASAAVSATTLDGLSTAAVVSAGVSVLSVALSTASAESPAVGASTSAFGTSAFRAATTGVATDAALTAAVGSGSDSNVGYGFGLPPVAITPPIQRSTPGIPA